MAQRIDSTGELAGQATVRPAFWDGRRKIAYGFVAPAFLTLLFLAIGPMIFMFFFSVHAWNLTVPAPARFVGLENFVKLVQDARFWNAFSNTLILLVVGIVVQSLLGLGIALLLREKFKFRSIVMALILIPVMIAPVVAGLNWKLIFNESFGPLNYLLGVIGVEGPLWLGSNKFWGLIAILIVDAWQWTPFVALVLLAGLEAIPRQVYEAADVDGASQFRVFFRITLPLLRPMFILVILLRSIFIFRIYDPVVILTGGGPGEATETLSLLTYNVGMKYLDIGYAMAMGVIQIIFMTILANVFLKFTKSSVRS
ncbi:MAG: carbohydrate ABC transporter permease [Chloroflexota bacterium]